MFSRSLLAGVAVLAFSATARAVTYNETFVLKGATSSAFGAANVSVGVDTTTHTLAWDVIFTGLSGPLTSAQFRVGSTPVVDIGAISGLVGPELKGTTDISTAQTNALVAGQWTLSLNTAANPNGEITGNLPALTTPEPAPVPEPAVVSLFALGAAALALRLTRRRAV